MARDKRTNGVDASEEVVNAFEAGIVFGRMVETRRPRRHPLWSEEEWLQALLKVVGKKAESQRSRLKKLRKDPNRLVDDLLRLSMKPRQTASVTKAIAEKAAKARWSKNRSTTN
jgi:hypothetical protein